MQSQRLPEVPDRTRPLALPLGLCLVDSAGSEDDRWSKSFGSDSKMLPALAGGMQACATDSGVAAAAAAAASVAAAAAASVAAAAAADVAASAVGKACLSASALAT